MSCACKYTHFIYCNKCTATLSQPYASVFTFLNCTYFHLLLSPVHGNSTLPFGLLTQGNFSRFIMVQCSGTQTIELIVTLKLGAFWMLCDWQVQREIQNRNSKYDHTWKPWAGTQTLLVVSEYMPSSGVLQKLETWTPSTLWVNCSAEKLSALASSQGAHTSGSRTLMKTWLYVILQKQWEAWIICSITLQYTDTLWNWQQ